MAEETDGIEEALEGQIRILTTAAGQVAECLARAREQALRRAQEHSEQQARGMRSRLEAEHRAARAELAGVHRTDWWDHAPRAHRPRLAGGTCLGTRGLQGRPSRAVHPRRAAHPLRHRRRQRGAAPADVQAAIQRAERDRAQADAAPTGEQAERAEAHRLIRDADH